MAKVWMLIYTFFWTVLLQIERVFQLSHSVFTNLVSS